MSMEGFAPTGSITCGPASAGVRTGFRDMLARIRSPAVVACEGTLPTWPVGVPGWTLSNATFATFPSAGVPAAASGASINCSNLAAPWPGPIASALLRFVGEPGLGSVKNLSLNLCQIDGDGDAPSMHWP